jgi:hypothetical protein
MSAITKPAGRSIGLLAQLGAMLAPRPAHPARRHCSLDGLDDHLLRDIGRARGAGGFDRRNMPGF